MNVTKPEKLKYSLRDKVMYATAILICALTLMFLIIIEISANTSIIAILDTSEAEAKSLGNKTNDEIERLKSEISSKFHNNIEKKSVSNNINKIDNSKDIVCTALEAKESKSGSYEINVILPVINIDSDIISKYNQEINDVFKSKLDSILQTENENIAYSTEYVASVNNNILSLMIRSNLKEGSKVQRSIIQTYNYDISADKELTLQDILKKNNLDESKIQKTITSEIESSQKRVEELREAGVSIYKRNVGNKMYEIKNSEEFYCTSNTIYIIYAYGNNDYTNEMDVVVI